MKFLHLDTKTYFPEVGSTFADYMICDQSSAGKTKIITQEDMVHSANKLIELGAKNVLIKGGHLQNKFVKDTIFPDKKRKDLKKIWKDGDRFTF